MLVSTDGLEIQPHKNQDAVAYKRPPVRRKAMAISISYWVGHSQSMEATNISAVAATATTTAPTTTAVSMPPKAKSNSLSRGVQDLVNGVRHQRKAHVVQVLVGLARGRKREVAVRQGGKGWVSTQKGGVQLMSVVHPTEETKSRVSRQLSGISSTPTDQRI